jgi:hypothetical protein
MAAAPYMADDLSVPLGRQPKTRRRVMKLDVPQMVAGLALFLAVFMLWMAIGDDPPARESTAVVPANLRIAAKPVGPPATASQAVAPPTIPPDLDNQATSALPTNSKTITIIDGKTGEKKEVVVSVPALTVASPGATTPTPAIPSGTVSEKDSTIATADRSIVWPDTSASLPDLRGAATIAAAAVPASSAPIPSMPDSYDFIDEVMPAVASLNGSIPLPRRRPAPFAMVQNAAMPAVPLPRVRPQEAPAPAPEPINDATAELMNDTSSGYEPGLSLGR